SQMPRVQAARNCIPGIPSGCIGGCRTSELNSRLPELYQPYTSCEPFPFALAMLLSRSEGVKMTLEQHSPQAIEADSSDLLRTMRCITGLDRDVHFPVCAEMGWKVSRDE
ncbi:hypothetical protein ABIE61_003435, partial [Marinobacterium sp. MBR-111]|uniref:hypothetical protein n=1 Tax=Marinobacterium sp. MBR-111 TaxID=3156463 RepID=UPI003392D377